MIEVLWPEYHAPVDKDETEWKPRLFNVEFRLGKRAVRSDAVRGSQKVQLLENPQQLLHPTCERTPTFIKCWKTSQRGYVISGISVAELQLSSM
jgi:hypothetical protein